MSLEPGRYFIQSLKNSSYFAGTGPVPPVWPPYPAPLRLVEGFIKDIFEVKSDGDNKYTMRVRSLWVGHDGDANVKLVGQGGNPVTWSVESTNGEGQFRIKVPNSNKAWTVSSEGYYTPIQLEEENGTALQEWKIYPIE
ncbi:hypothetical protein RHS04_01594 [Rhizoctonia solani]|uniref:Ricin B lectin domain-containing protein n=1 Tax=Rhizoctonia solani TaxID=456999 RepID=A0A8H7LMZ9_9AGAM|nr:hypothetical protein RHS04_01594 [Rhizoctonia solani]